MRDLISIIPFEQNTYNIIKYYNFFEKEAV